MPIVSVIIPAYNVEKFLRQCLDSVISQSLTDIEVICVDDGSSDSTAEILEEYACRDSRVQWFSRENEGKGAAAARNDGIDRAIGKYLAIVDSDDYFEPLHLEKLVTRAEETGADVVICDAQGFDSMTGNPTYNAVCYPQRDLPDKYVFNVSDYPDKIFQISTTAAWNGLYRRSFIEKHKIRFQRVIMTDDLYFSFSARVLANKISVVNEKLIHYRMNSGISQSDRLTKYPDSAYPAYKKMQESLIEWGLYDKVKQSFVNSAANTFRGAYDRIAAYDSFARFHQQLNDDIFPYFGINEHDESYFYDVRTHQWIRLVTDHSPEEVAFLSARGYKAPMTTGILRFQISDDIQKKERIELKKGNIEGIYHYVQLMFLGINNKVVWKD